MLKDVQTTLYLPMSHASKVMAQILQAWHQQYMNQELPDVQDGFWRGSRTRDQIANILWIIKKSREFQKNIYFCFTDYNKAFDCVDHNKRWKILLEMGIPDHLTCLLRNLYVDQEATGKEVVCCHPAYLTSVQSTSWESLSWMNHRLESRLLGEISTTSDMQMTPL